MNPALHSTVPQENVALLTFLCGTVRIPQVPRGVSSVPQTHSDSRSPVPCSPYPRWLELGFATHFRRVVAVVRGTRGATSLR